MRLTTSSAVREQQMAFACATGVPLALMDAKGDADEEDALCVKGCLGEPSGTFCQQKLREAERHALDRRQPTQYACPSGLVKILVPVCIGDRHVGTLLAGPFALHSLDGVRLEQLVDRLERLGLRGRVSRLRTTWRHSPLLSSNKCRAAATLLEMFAKYLEEAGRQELRTSRRSQSALLEKIEAFLASCKESPVTLKEVAARVNLSPCHFCSVFKKQTGMTFSQYRTNRRLDIARDLLGDAHRRVSDVAFEAGFESIPYFNRAFRRRFGCSPSEYRSRPETEIQGKKTEI